MKVVGLVSGGKDSCYSMMECVKYGHDICILGNLYSSEAVDSFMFQTVGVDMSVAIAECMGVKLVRRQLHGASVNTSLDYIETDGDEIEDLYELLSECKKICPGLEAVCSGAILSTYQRNRVESVCARLGLVSLAYLWQRDQREVLTSMIDEGVEAVMVKIASMGLKGEMMGRPLASLVDTFDNLYEDFGFHVCGEGGEYETVTLYCPLFKNKRIVLDEVEYQVEDIPFSPVGELIIKKYHIEELLVDNDFSDDFLWVKGLVGNPASDIEEQMRECLDALSSRVDLNQVCFVQLYVPDMSLFDRVNMVYSDYFSHIKSPSRACVEIESSTIMISACAAKGEREVLHVRSYSTWAPLCIGPYSQSNTVADTRFVAGQIALDPVNMKMKYLDDAGEQLKLAFRHCKAILFDAEIIAMVVYVTVPLDSIEEILALESYLVVQVPRLPRDALVEVQVLGSTGTDIYSSFYFIVEGDEIELPSEIDTLDVYYKSGSLLAYQLAQRIKRMVKAPLALIPVIQVNADPAILVGCHLFFSGF